MLLNSVDASHDFLMPLSEAAFRAARGSELLNLYSATGIIRSDTNT